MIIDDMDKSLRGSFLIHTLDVLRQLTADTTDRPNRYIITDTHTHRRRMRERAAK